MFRKLAGLSTRTKLTAIVASLLLPMAMLFYFDIAGSLSTIHSARSEDLGNDWERPLIDVARDLVEHRDHVAAVAAGHDGELEEMKEHQGRIHASVKKLDELDKDNVGGLSKSVEWGALRAAVVAAADVDVKDANSHDLHETALMGALLAVNRVATVSGLSLDPDAAGFALIDANILQLPVGLQALAQGRRNFDALTAGDNTPKMRAALGEQMGTAKALLSVVFTDLTEHYAKAAPGDKATVQAAEAARDSFEELLPKILSVGQGAQLSADQIKQISEKTEDLTETLADVQDKGMATLEGILNARVRAKQSDLIVHVGVVLLCLALAVAIALWVTRYLGSQVAKANGVFTRM